MPSYVVVEYDPRWPGLYARQAQRLSTALGSELVEIEHTGSTAVPGLAAKPVIDIALGVRSVDWPELVPCVVSLGFEYVPSYEAVLPFRRYFRRHPDEEVAPGIDQAGWHLHVVEAGHPFMSSDVAFRNHLRTHPADAAAYADVKVALSGLEAQEYIDGKAPFVQELKRRIGAEVF